MKWPNSKILEFEIDFTKWCFVESFFINQISKTINHNQNDKFRHISYIFQNTLKIVVELSLLLYNHVIGRVDRASTTETIDSGSIPGGVKPKTIKIGIHSFPA